MKFSLAEDIRLFLEWSSDLQLNTELDAQYFSNLSPINIHTSSQGINNSFSSKMKGIHVLFFLSFVLASANAARPSARQGRIRETYRRYNPYYIAPGRKYNATVYFAAHGFAKLFLNGVRKASVYNWRVSRTTSFLVRKYDVISIAALNKQSSGGVIAGVIIKGKHYATGSWHWRARHPKRYIKKTWMVRRRGFCWSRPRLYRGRKSHRARNIPYAYGAKYVWPMRYPLGMKRGAILRFVVGGNGCRHMKWRPPGKSPRKPKPKPRPSGKKYCRCKLAKAKRGVCFELKNPKQRVGRCKRRRCERSYECVVNGSRRLPLCIRRYAFDKVVLIKRGKCRKIRVKQVLWLPYMNSK